MIPSSILKSLSPIAFRCPGLFEKVVLSGVRRIKCSSLHTDSTSHSDPRSDYTKSDAIHQRSFSQESNGNASKENSTSGGKIGLVQRFKQSYAIYGKVVIVVHGIGSCFWFGGFYLLASSGISILELFEAANFPNWICSPLRMGGGSVNTWATTLVMYKLASPLRYGLTLFLTRYVVRYLRTSGRAPQLVEEDRLRNLAREGAKLSGEKFKARMKRNGKKAMILSRNVRRKVTSLTKDTE